ncbi:MAG: Vps62-related protein [Thermoplasmatales archaeon]|nr:Vps62-related protein [Thermoplasmatales archaeon]
MKLSIILVFICAFLVIPFARAIDTDKDGISDEDELSYAKEFAPILYFEKGEEVYPVAVEYHIKNSNLNKSVDGENILVDSNPSAENLSKYKNPDENYYLDNRKGSIDDNGIIEDYINEMEELGYAVYARVTPSGSNIVIQYWFFYAFNKGPLNIHEGDWEMVQLIIDPSSQPTYAMYSQHNGGQKAEWKDVEKDGNHIKVYVARGSHANYFMYYQGKTGLANDAVGKNGKIIYPDDYNLVILWEKGNHISQQNWIDFAGRWGEFGSAEDELRGKRGPYGPAYRENGEMWNKPVEWGESLSSLSPLMLKLDWFFYNFVLIFMLLTVLSLLIILFSIYRRYKKTGKKSLFFLSIDGMNAKSIGNILCILGIVIAFLSLLFPWYSVFVDIQAGSYKTPGMVKIISIDGMEGIKLNLMEKNSGLVQFFSFPIPFSYVIGIGLFLFILGFIGIIESRKAGRKYISRGIKLMVPFILIIAVAILISRIPSMQSIPYQDDIKEIMEKISSSPLKGDENLLLPNYGSLHLKWGIDIGAIMLLISGIILIIAGIIEIKAKEEVK